MKKENKERRKLLVVNSAFFKKGYGTIVNWVAISFVGILLLILGVWQLFHESVALSDTLNVWSILVALWAFVDYLFDISTGRRRKM